MESPDARDVGPGAIKYKKMKDVSAYANDVVRNS